MLNEAGEAITEASRESSVTESSVAQTTVISESRDVSESGNPGWQASTLADLEEYGSEQESQEPSMVSEQPSVYTEKEDSNMLVSNNVEGDPT